MKFSSIIIAVYASLAGGIKKLISQLKKSLKSTSKVGRILLIFFVLMFLLSGIMIIKELTVRNNEQKEFSELADLVNSEEIDIPTTQAPSKSEKAQKKKKTVRNVKKAISQNNECIGWICIPSTVIDYPVMHTPNDPEKYLHLNFYKKHSNSGTPFMDYRCTEESDNILVYGHNMINGSMFHTLKKYQNTAYAKNHSVIDFETAKGCRKYKVFAVCKVKDNDKWYNCINFDDEEDFSKKIDRILKITKYKTDTVPKFGEKLITLSTCTSGNENSGRLIVIAKEIK